MKRIAINGFGRIGRLTARQILKNPNLEIVGINDLTDNQTLAHLFKYDSAHGIFDGTVSYDDQSITINGKKIKSTSIKEVSQLPWKELNVDVVLECTGVFLAADQCSLHLAAGARKVILSAPPKDTSIPTFVLGVNDSEISSDINILSNASCTTNCLAPVIKILDESLGLQFASMNTIHAYTQDQRLQDAPHKDLRRARAAAINLVPTSTGAAKAVEVVYPKIKGKLLASSYRVPLITGSMIELVCVMNRPVTVEEVNEVFKQAAGSTYKGLVQYNEDEIVSSDIIGNPHSSIFDAPLTQNKGDKLKLVAWYDNESGYSARLSDMCAKVASLID
ncbi:MAG TPA: type I glyceraldehyde-3-phosphate dehydrogenase [Saprospiraceae bacterium]|nr:type I glyceraldehyde-3-phosphate dehydrogenase [Saprospiraceae bacterium]